jgi:hypothetical protein
MYGQNIEKKRRSQTHQRIRGRIDSQAIANALDVRWTGPS